MSRNTMILCVLIYGWDLANTKLATPNPADVFCREMAYVVESDRCVFPDSHSCELGAFLNADCGEEYVHPVACAEAGKHRGVAVACCQDLAEIANTFPFEHICVHLLGFSLCSACGDEICDDWENPCNCPEDCQLCVGEGETVPVIADPPPCCGNLTLIPPMSPGSFDIHGYCTEFCGDGVCDPGTETSFNCRADCRRGKHFNRRRLGSPGETRLTAAWLPHHLRNLAALIQAGSAGDRASPSPRSPSSYPSRDCRQPGDPAAELAVGAR